MMSAFVDWPKPKIDGVQYVRFGGRPNDGGSNDGTDGSTIAPTMPVRICDGVVERLNWLHDTAGLSWREIARLDDYRPIPAGTLCAIAASKHVPKKWRKRLPNRPRARRAISLTNPASAAATIRAHMAESVRRELVDLLYDLA